MLRNEKKPSEQSLRCIRSRLKDQNENPLTSKTYHLPQAYPPSQNDQIRTPDQISATKDLNYQNSQNPLQLPQKKKKNPLRDITNSEPENGQSDIKNLTNLITKNISNILLEQKFSDFAGKILGNGEEKAINFVEKNRRV
jgi:hypothetical protein